MPRVPRRTKINRKIRRTTKLDRRICPACGAEVTRWDRGKVQRCFGCHKCLVWDSAKKVPASRVQGRPTFRYSGCASPPMSTIEEHSESGDDCSWQSSGSSLIDDDARTPDHDLLRWCMAVTPQGKGRSIDGDGNAVTAFARPAMNHEDDTVVDEAFVDPVPAHTAVSTPPKDEQSTLSIREITNKNDTAPLCTTAVPELISDAPRPTSPHPTCPRITSPCPSSPRPTPKKKTFRFRERFRRRRSETTEPRPSLEDDISIPEVVPRQRAAELLHTLFLARYTRGRGTSTERVTASPAIVPQEPHDILQQHAANLHDALARLEALKVDSSDEESASSGRSSFWSRLACFL